MDDWIAFYQAKSTEERHKILYNMLNDVDIIMDIPGFLFWNEIMTVFPDCKAIFYERDMNSWYKSFLNQRESNLKRGFPGG